MRSASSGRLPLKFCVVEAVPEEAADEAELLADEVVAAAPFTDGPAAMAAAGGSAEMATEAVMLAAGGSGPWLATSRRLVPVERLVPPEEASEGLFWPLSSALRAPVADPSC